MRVLLPVMVTGKYRKKIMETNIFVGHYFDDGLECMACPLAGRVPTDVLLADECVDGFTCCACGDVYMPEKKDNK